MAIRNDRMGQSWLLPPAVTDLIPEDHICNLVVAVVKSVAVREAEKKYRFKRECKELIEEVFKETVTIAKALRIPELGHISTDGTKMKANASNNYTLSEEEIEGIERAKGKRLKSAVQH
jgi:hypothetical protein